MIKFIINLFYSVQKEERPQKGGRILSHVEIKAIFSAIDSCKLEGQVQSALEWVAHMLRKKYYSMETYKELKNYALIKLEKIVTEKVHQEYVLPYVKKRADELTKEERTRNIYIINSQNQ